MEERTSIEDHIPEEILLDYIENRADEPMTARARAHLDTGCERCTTELTEWTRLLTALSGSGSTAPPEGVLERAIRIIDRRRDHRRVPTPAAFGLPSVPPAVTAAHAASMRLLFRAAATDIDLLCEYEGGGWHIMGQALSADAPGAGWCVAAMGATGLIATETDRQGEFRLSRLAPGDYKVALRGANRRIVLPILQLGGARP